jgi:hypothetical protein
MAFFEVALDPKDAGRPTDPLPIAATAFAADLTARGVTWRAAPRFLVYEGPPEEIRRLQGEAMWPALCHRYALYRLAKMVERISRATAPLPS